MDGTRRTGYAPAAARGISIFARRCHAKYAHACDIRSVGRAVGACTPAKRFWAASELHRNLSHKFITVFVHEAKLQGASSRPRHVAQRSLRRQLRPGDSCRKQTRTGRGVEYCVSAGTAGLTSRVSNLRGNNRPDPLRIGDRRADHEITPTENGLSVHDTWRVDEAWRVRGNGLATSLRGALLSGFARSAARAANWVDTAGAPIARRRARGIGCGCIERNAAVQEPSVQCRDHFRRRNAPRTAGLNNTCTAIATWLTNATVEQKYTHFVLPVGKAAANAAHEQWRATTSFIG